MIFGTMHHNQPRFPFFFIYLYSGWILFLDLDLVSSGKDGKKKRKKGNDFPRFRFNVRIARQGNISWYFSASFFPATTIFQGPTYLTEIPPTWHPLFPSFDSPFLSPERIRIHPASRQFAIVLHRPTKRFHPFASTRFTPPYVTLKFRANNSSSIHKGEEKRNFNITSVKTKFDSYHLSSCIYKSRSDAWN